MAAFACWGVKLASLISFASYSHVHSAQTPITPRKYLNDLLNTRQHNLHSKSFILIVRTHLCIPILNLHAQT